jgi:hypothetical protein
VERYLEWRDQNDGKPRDVSPKAFALEEALAVLDRNYEDIVIDGFGVDIVGDLVDAYREMHADG